MTLRTNTSVDGRLNLAVAEHSVDLWMPTDLTSAQSVSIDALATPCGATVCGGVDFSTGSTALLLSWTNRVGSAVDDVVTTSVAYLFAPSSSGDGTYDLTRVECIGGECIARVMLRGLAVPLNSDGTPAWSPGDEVPAEVIRVTNPLRFEDGVEMSDSENIKNARRVVVTINGGGTGDGAGGGTNVISVTAGGTARDDLPAKAAYQMPSLVQPRSRCGGPIVLIVDESGSLGATGVAAVRQGVVDFIEALDGTPVQLMVVPFNSLARSLGGDNDLNWHKYWDMSDPSQVDAVRNLASSDIQIGGGGEPGTRTGRTPGSARSSTRTARRLPSCRIPSCSSPTAFRTVIGPTPVGPTRRTLPQTRRFRRATGVRATTTTRRGKTGTSATVLSSEPRRLPLTSVERSV